MDIANRLTVPLCTPEKKVMAAEFMEIPVAPNHHPVQVW